MMYGLIMSIVGIAICISAVVTNSDNEDLADNIEVCFKKFFKLDKFDLRLLLFFSSISSCFFSLLQLCGYHFVYTIYVGIK
jgi:hypothetical protein